MHDLSSYRFLVTGGAGFIGSSIVDTLLQRGARAVRILDDFSSGRRVNIAPFGSSIELYEGDLRDADRVMEAVDGMDFVLHQGAIPSVPRSVDDPIATTAVNVQGTVNLLHAAVHHKVRRFVMASSSSVYGDSAELPKHENMPLYTMSPYAASKAAGELYCRSFFEVYGLETVCLRYFNIFGPRQDPRSQYAAVIPSFTRALKNDEPIQVYGDGLQTRDFTFVGNVIDANLRACFAENAPGGRFNIGCGEQISLLELARGLAETMGKTLRVDHLPPRTGDVRHSLADISLAASGLGYRPQFDLQYGLVRTVDYFLSQPDL